MWSRYVSKSYNRLTRTLLVQVLSSYSARSWIGPPALVAHKPQEKLKVGARQDYRQPTRRSCSGTSEAVQGAFGSEMTASSVCCGCGATLQSENQSSPGFIPEQKNRPSPGRNEEDNGHERRLICQRCFALKHYNTALNITLKMDDYVRHLTHIKDSRVLILLMVDVVDFPGSLFPELNTFVTAPAQVMVVANKIDLLPDNVKPDFWSKFASYIVHECSRTSLAGCNIAGVHFVSAKTGEGVCKLTDAIHSQWGNRGDVYLLGCTNVGKSSLFNLLLATLCGARPGELQTTSNVSAPMATVSNWPGTTLGLLKFPILSVGKRKRLIAKAKQREGTGQLSDFTDIVTYPDDEEEDINDSSVTTKKAKVLRSGHRAEPEDALVEVGLHQHHRNHNTPGELEPKNRFWLYDTPGAINDAQVRRCGVLMMQR